MRNGFNWKQALVGLVSLCATSVFANGSPPPIVIVLNTVVQLTANKSVAAKDEPIVFSGIVTIKGGGQLQSGCAGTIALKDSDGSAVASTSLAGNCTYSLAVTSLKVGLHGVTASFGGGGGMEPSQSPSNSVSVRIIGLADPHITLSASENATFAKSKATVFATFANDYTGIPSPTGVVTFMDGTTVLGTAKVSNFVAQLPISLDTGSHSITAQYAGDTQYATATTAGLTVATNTNTTPMNWMFGYDAMNRRNNVVDPNGNQSYTYYDFPGRKVQEVTAANSANQAVVDYTYNDADALTNVKDPRSLSTAYTVDGLGQAKSQVSPDSGTTSYTYDVAGRVLSKTDARGKVASYTYDGLGRLLTVSYNGVQAVVLEYDGGALQTPEAKGKLTKVSDATGSTSYVYDIYGRVVQRTKVIGAKSFVTAMTYGTSGPSLGQVTSVTYPSGNVVNYTYAANGALNAITVTPVQSNGSSGVGVTTARSLLSQLTLDASGRVGGYYQGGAFTMVNYDNYGRLSSYNLGDAYAFPVSNGVIRTIGYDAGGRITSYTHTKDGVNVPELNQSFVYDKQSRLTSTTVGTVTTQYSYDATGNRTSKVINGVTYTNAISASSNRQVSVQDVGGTFNVTYDAVGNVVSDGVNTYTYNDKGRMMSATTSSGAVTNQYDAFDLRVAKTAAGVTTYYVYDDTGVLIGEYDANGAMVTESVYLDGGTPVSLLKHSGNAASNTLTVDLYNVYADHLGAPRIVTRQSDNKMVWRWDSAESYGGSAPNEDPSGVGAFVYNQRFPGQVFDKETGLFQNWHRDYNPRIGRYMQSDPIGLEGGINTYEYVAGSPTMFVDPMGLDAWSREDKETGRATYDPISHGQGNINRTDLPTRDTTQDQTQDLWSLTKSVFKQVGFKLARDFVDNQQVRFGFAGWLADELEESASEYEPDSLEGKIAGAIVFATAIRNRFKLGAAKGVATEAAAVTDISFGVRATKKSATQLNVNLTQTQAIDNLAANGFSKAVSKDGTVTIMSNGDKTYRFYPSSTGGGVAGAESGVPSASVSVMDKIIAKLRFLGE